MFRLIALVLFTSTTVQSLKAILVTGANKGIGKAIAKRIIKTNDEVYIFLGSRDVGRGVEAANDINSDRVTVLPLDVADDASVAAAAKVVSESGFALTGICNNAGIGFGHGFPETLNANFWGTKRVCDAFIPLLEQTGSRVVNIASASGPNFVAKLPKSDQRFFISPDTTWEDLEERIKKTTPMMDYDNSAYGFSKV